MSVLFTGTFQHGIDEKGRIIIPMKLRDAVQEERDGAGFYMTRGLDGCIFLYTPRDFEALRHRVQGEPGTVMDKEHRNLERMLYSNAIRGQCDRQGRIVIPDYLKEHAKIQKDVIITGVGQRIEVWAKERWDALMEQVTRTFEEDAQGFYDKERPQARGATAPTP
ncbi:MAG: division/cell wall cluster transcriptional repressor MraZ [Planctomycetota bacterium]